MMLIHPFERMNRVYCAGPLFNEAERREMVRIAYVLNRSGFESFVPHADGMEFAEVHPYLIAQGFDAAQAGQTLHEAVFALDVYQVLCGCGALVFNMNGRVPDEGAVAEATMAWMLGKPLVIYKEDVRSFVSGRDNPLLVGQTGFQCVDDLEQLPDALQRRINASPHAIDETAICPPHLQPVLRKGERLWNDLQSLGRERPNATVAEIVLEIFGRPEPALDEVT